jgi:hypothetical protein
MYLPKIKNIVQEFLEIRCKSVRMLEPDIVYYDKSKVIVALSKRKQNMTQSEFNEYCRKDFLIRYAKS